jgi:hypothetical protein
MAALPGSVHGEIATLGRDDADAALLEEAVHVGRRAVALTPAEHPSRGAHMGNLGVAYLSVYEERGTTNDLAEALQLLRHAVALTPADSPHRAGLLHNLGTALARDSDRTGDTATLEEAVAVVRQALELAGSGAARMRHLDRLSFLLGLLYEKTDDLSTLESSVALAREALLATDDDDPAYEWRRRWLAQAAEQVRHRTGAPAEPETVRARAQSQGLIDLIRSIPDASS